MQALKNKKCRLFAQRHGLEGNFITEEHALSLYPAGHLFRCGLEQRL